MNPKDQILHKIITNHIINIVKPLADKHNLPLETWNANYLGRLCKLQAEGKIDSMRVRKWCEERIGEKDIVKLLGISGNVLNSLDEIEILSLEGYFK